MGTEDMATAMATSGNEGFTGGSYVNGVDLSGCYDSFGTGWFNSSPFRGELGYSTGEWIDVEKHFKDNPLGPQYRAQVKQLVDAAWWDSTSIATNQVFQRANCLCDKNGCNWGC